MKHLRLIVLLLAMAVLGTRAAWAQTAADIYGAADLGAAGTPRGGTGSATLAHTGSSTQLMLTIQGLAAGSQGTAHVHQGSCSGPVLGSLAVRPTGRAGTVSATTQIPGTLDFVAGDSWALDLHMSGAPGAAPCSSFHPALAGGGLLPVPAGGPGMPATGLPDPGVLGMILACLGLVGVGSGVLLRQSAQA